MDLQFLTEISTMYAKTYAFALIALWAFNACLASPAPEAKPSGGHGNDCCCIHRCHNVPITSCIPIRTTHRLIPSSNCRHGYGGGWGGYGGGWGGYDCGYGGHGGWGGSECDCGYGGGHGRWGRDWCYGGGHGGWGYDGCDCGHGGW